MENNQSTSAPKERDELLQTFAGWNHESENNLTAYKARWTKNMRLVKGIYPETTNPQSKTRKRSKIFFRKIWAEKWRIIAAFYNAFLRDRKTFNLEGVDELDDPRKARVLGKLVDYRKREMMRKDDLFLQFIHAFEDIFDYGFAVGKMHWLKKEDRPTFTLYPPEQVKPDMNASTPSKREYLIFINYLTREEIEALNYDEEVDIDKLQPTTIPEDTLRAQRFAGRRDPMKPVTENQYPSPEKLTTQEKQSFRDRYEVWEVFWREDGKIKFAVSHRDEVFLKKAVDSPYGNEDFPDITGLCLVEAHKQIGEGFPEVLEGPQESLNHTLNMRKDELSLALNSMNIVNRYAGVDIESLANVRPSGIVFADSTEGAVERLDVANVTATAYAEAAADEAMMEEMSGVTDIKKGMGKETKATVAQINLSESNAKIDLLTAIVAETFVKNFYFKLAQLEQRFETDKMIFRIANEPLRMQGALGLLEDDILDVDDFEADIILEVGLDKVSQGIRLNQRFLAMDKMIMSNQSMAGVMGIPGAVPPQGLRFFDLTKVMDEVLPDMGMKNRRDFYFQSGQPQLPPQGAGGGGASIQGSLTPQVGGAGPPMAGGLAGL